MPGLPGELFKFERGFQILFPKADVEESSGVFIFFVKRETIGNIVTRGVDIIIDMDFITDIFSK